ncbi:MAG: hypothetical protein AB7F67_20755 [Rhodospirillaceae bacterium]
MPSNPLIAALLAAVGAGGPQARERQGGWVAGRDGAPVFLHGGRKRGTVSVTPEFDRGGGQGNGDKPPDLDALWGLVESLNPFTADVALAVLAELCAARATQAQRGPLIDSTVITAGQILAYKAVAAWDKDAPALRARIRDEMARLRTLAFAIDGYPVFDPATGRWRQDGASWSGDRLFDIVEVNTPGAEGPSWFVRAGQWAYWWLNPQGRFWVGRISLALLELNHRTTSGFEPIAKKIGQHLSILSVALRHPATIDRRVDRLLAAVGELPREDARGPHWAARTRARLERAAQALKSLGVIDDVSWPDGHGPDDARAGHWVNDWLDARVRFAMPATLPAGPAAAAGDTDALH